MIRASTTPSIAATSRLIASAIERACGMSLPESRMLIGDDLPSFIAERIMPPASKANSRSENSGSDAKPGAEQVDVLLGRVLALVLELDLDDGVHRPGVGRVGGRQVGDDAELGDDHLQVLAELLADELLDLRDPLLGLLDPRAAGGPGVDLEGAGVDLGEELAAELRAQQTEHRGQQARPKGPRRSR